MDTAEKLSGDAAIVLQVKVCLGVWALNLGATDAVETGRMIRPLRIAEIERVAGEDVGL